MKKTLILAILLLSNNLSHAQIKSTEAINTYGLHLFFNEQEFIDVLTITKSVDGTIKGHMFVPDDFEGDIENIQVLGDNIEFDLFVPKNAARPEDLMFHYTGRFFNQAQQQLIGYVTLKGKVDFVASFTAFKR